MNKFLKSTCKSPNLYYLNPLFDLSLGGYKTRGLAQSASEMSCLFIPMATSEDSILLDVSVPNEYREYFISCGLDWPERSGAGEHCAGMNGVPWGWNENAIKKFIQAGAYCNNPELSVVKTVNSRKFSFVYNQKSGTGIPGAEYCESMEQLTQALKSWHCFPFVIKPVFGNAGYGFIHKSETRFNNRELKKLDVLLSEGNGVVIEPWYNRIVDISSRCVIDSDGNITGIRHHRALSNKVGTFFADWLDPDDEAIIKWQELLDKAAINGAKELYKAGYFGPAGFDSFTWRDGSGKEQLAAVIEINARHPISSVAYALHDRLAPDCVSMFRLISKKRHRLPDNYETILKILGDDAFNTETQKGVVLITPLRVCHGNDNWIQPKRSAFFLAAETSEQLHKLDERLKQLLVC